MFAALSLQKTCVYVSSSLSPFNHTFPSYVIWLTATCHPALPPADWMWRAQLSVVSPLSVVKDTLAVSLRYGVSGLTDPESCGQPVPENTSCVILGKTEGVARIRVGREKRRSERIVIGRDVRVSQWEKRRESRQGCYDDGILQVTNRLGRKRCGLRNVEKPFNGPLHVGVVSTIFLYLYSVPPLASTTVAT